MRRSVKWEGLRVEPLLSASRAAGRGVKQHGSRKPKWRGEQRPPRLTRKATTFCGLCFFFCCVPKAGEHPWGVGGGAMRYFGLKPASLLTSCSAADGDSDRHVRRQHAPSAVSTQSDIRWGGRDTEAPPGFCLGSRFGSRFGHGFRSGPARNMTPEAWPSEGL